MKLPQITLIASATVLIGIAATVLNVRANDNARAAAPVKAALTVTVVKPHSTNLALKLGANGNVAAWQEASIGTESNGLRLAEVRVNVGDVVKRGQVLATFATETVAADLMQIKAGVAEAEANAIDAAANAERARSLQETGALSRQQISQYVTAAQTAKARLDAQRAAARVQQLRLSHTQVLAPDAGVISARNATVGAVMPAGQELFRLIRKGRLEWRAEVSSTELALLKPGISVIVTPANGSVVKGKVRMVAPTVDLQTRNALVYVDLPASSTAKAGMFAHGEFEIGSSQALTLPQSAVVLRDGFHYVLRVGPDSKVVQTKVKVGRRVADRIEITEGIDISARVVASGGGFLGDGDTVRVVDAAATGPAAAAVAQ